jgi:hypothetical protein
MKKVYYEKRGRRYYPVSEYDSNLMDSMPKGSHLICVYPGGQSTRYNVEPNYAAMIAAGRVAQDAIAEVVRQAGEIRPTISPITQKQRTAYTEFMKTLPENERYYLTYGSARDAAEAGVKALQDEAEALMKHEAVRLAYEHFIMVCKLTVDQ